MAHILKETLDLDRIFKLNLSISSSFGGKTKPSLSHEQSEEIPHLPGALCCSFHQCHYNSLVVFLTKVLVLQIPSATIQKPG